jgi:hypothetical protein
MGRTLGAVALLVVGCAHQPLSAQGIEVVQRPAFISRIVEGAGPKSTVFRDDSSWAPRLKKLDAKEGDRRLTLKLEKGSDTERTLSRFVVADTLRSQVLSELPRSPPWTKVAPTTQVAALLESFLVDEVPANEPDVSRLKPLGIDTIIEIVVEDFGLRSAGGKAGVYLYGYARLYQPGGDVLYRRAFFSDELRAGLEPLDPFEVNKHPAIFATRLKAILLAVAHQIALDLSPATREAAKDSPPGGEDPVAPQKKSEDDPL